LNVLKPTFLALALGLLAVSCGGSVGTPVAVDTTNMKISVDSTYITSVQVGSHTKFDITIKDVGTADIPNLSILFDSGDRFMDKYTIEATSSCQVDKGLPGLKCGKLAHNTEVKVTITAQPKTTGSYVFKFHVGNNKTPLNQDDDNQYVYSWTQSVTA
jgi:hypothetical protein